ncbi:Zn-dependent exopeptidase [Annulohypoxylon truncatum]|uniref:Zn-dependent exopeptidase n=1 Tax=Annulohypoxylon truncatum TaxID=327061 RepID=UPI0020083E52|nr:Zn-dependent exopeptidase [Annulohypoxylon truncatum]KAI1209510.1 Zn-dependent exopeptidase [Annulohypoxylon truncatum]
MPSEKSQYIPPPPIPTYDEATGGHPSGHRPHSPIDTRPDHETEAQSLLFSRSRQADSSRRAPDGYRPPYVESDDEGSQWTLEDDDSDDGENARVRREMQELEVEDPLDDASSRSSTSSWTKRIASSLPQWKWQWRWRLPRFTVRLPRQNEATNSQDGEPTETRRFRWPKINSAAAILLVGRLLAIFLILGFLYILFMSDLFTKMTRRIGGHMFDPEAVRQYVQAEINSDSMRTTLKHFTSYAHIAGTEGDYALAMDVRNDFMNYGLEDVTVDEYQVYLNFPIPGGRAVQIMSEDGKEAAWTAALEEKEVGEETAGHQTLVFHGHSKAGDVRGPLIYANYGSREDFKMLADKGIDTKGAIALVRYYGTQGDRALKIKAAELAGFAGCIIYSDPADDGFVKGEPAPNGRYMPADGVQRGGVSLMSWVVGDVLTPGWESKEGQPRMEKSKAVGLVGIPSLPLAWRDAQVLLQHIQGFGEPCPNDWQGGVPDVEWWSGNSSSPIVRLKNEQDENERQKIWNIYGRITGIEQNEKSIIIGNHRDAWAFGATDPNSGTAIMLEVARIFGDLLGRGWRPLRTIEFMSWDAEEYNLIGSTEYVENNLEALQKDAFAYINLDTAVSGQEFHAAASPVFRKVLYKVLDRVIDPNFNTTLRALWDGRNAELEGLGAGSDYVAFQDIAGTSSIDIRFDGAAHPYHSSYDNFDWMDRVSDPGFIYHNLLGQVLGLLILELADRPVLPFDMGNYALSLGRYLGNLWQWGEDKGVNEHYNLDPIKDAVNEVEKAVSEFERWESSWQSAVLSSNGWEPVGLGQKRGDYNSRMANFETGLLDLEFGGGIPNRTQFKHVVFGPQLWSGYDEAFFPAIRDAVDAEDWSLTQKLIDKTADIITKAAKALLE